MADWIMARVQDRLESAADVMRLLPGVIPKGYFNAWPEYFHTFATRSDRSRGCAGRARARARSPRPRRQCCGYAGSRSTMPGWSALA
jgi:hypothetical protein